MDRAKPLDPNTLSSDPNTLSTSDPSTLTPDPNKLSTSSLSSSDPNTLSHPSPENKKQRVNGSEEMSVSFEECLNAFFAAESVDLFNPSLQQIVHCVKTTRFKTFPRYLMVKLGRYSAGPNWVQVKINAKVEVPEFLDLSAFRALPPGPGEVPMPEESARNSHDASTAPIGT